MDQASRQRMSTLRAARLAACLLLLLACVAAHVWHCQSRLQAAGSLHMAPGSSSLCSRLGSAGAGSTAAAAKPLHTHRRTAKMAAPGGVSLGLKASRCDPQVPRKHICRIAVVGERHSGTNLAEQLLARNLDPTRVSVGAGLTAHKHWMQPLPADPEQLAHTLVVVPVRNPYDWSVALHRVCYCCAGMSNYGFAEFVRLPYLPEQFTRDSGSGLPCASDVNIQRRSTFGSVIDMRTAKLRSLIDMGRQLGVPVELVRLEDMLQPEGQAAFVRRLVSKYGLPLADRAAPTAGPEDSTQQQQQQQQERQQPGGGSTSVDAQHVPASQLQADDQAGGQAEDGADNIAADSQAASRRSAQAATQGLAAEHQAGSAAGDRAATEAGELSQDPLPQHFLDGTFSPASGTAGQLDGGQAATQQAAASEGNLVVDGIVTLSRSDARWFVDKSFSARSRVASSLYLNERMLVQHWERLEMDIKAINAQLDWQLEQQLGYHSLPTPGQAKAIARQHTAQRRSSAGGGGMGGGGTGDGGTTNGGMVRIRRASVDSQI